MGWKAKAAAADMKRKHELIGMNFGRLTVIAEEQYGPSKNRRWRCRCDCGNEVIRSQICLLNGKAYSCGCHSIQQRRGEAARAYPKEHRNWLGMIERCTNPNCRSWPCYGGRGIEVFARWREFPDFIIDVIGEIGIRPSDQHQLDRIDNNGNYEPGNIRWSLPRQQQRNRRNNRRISGRLLIELAEQAGVSSKLVRQRLDRDGMTLEQALRYDGKDKPHVAAP